MAVTDFFADEIATELVKLLVGISRKSLLCKSSANQLLSYIEQLLPIVEEIKYSGFELSTVRQLQLDRISEMLLSGVELSHKVLSSSRWNVCKNLRLAKKMEKLQKDVSSFVSGPMQAHILADVHHTRVEMAERFDRLEQCLAAIKVGDGGGGWMESAVGSMEEENSVSERNNTSSSSTLN